MQTQVKAWGNGQGLRFSKEFLNTAGIHVNDYLNLSIENGNIVLSKVMKHRTLEERTAEFRGQLGPYEEFDWGEAEGRERW